MSNSLDPDQADFYQTGCKGYGRENHFQGRFVLFSSWQQSIKEVDVTDLFPDAYENMLEVCFTSILIANYSIIRYTVHL